MGQCPHLDAKAGGMFSSSEYYCKATMTSISESTARDVCYRDYGSCYQYKKKPSGGCYLTTACLEVMKDEFQDDCEELTILRNFRDEYVKNNYPNAIERYYQIAPKIVKAINNTENKCEVYSSVYHDMIVPTIKCIEEDFSEKAYHIYESYTATLEKKFLHQEHKS